MVLTLRDDGSQVEFHIPESIVFSLHCYSYSVLYSLSYNDICCYNIILCYLVIAHVRYILKMVTELRGFLVIFL